MAIGIEKAQSRFVESTDLDHQAILNAGGHNCGNECFHVCACPECGHIYLLEYEADAVYFDAHDLHQRFYPDKKTRFQCTQCGCRFPRNGAWIGPKAPSTMRVKMATLMDSA